MEKRKIAYLLEQAGLTMERVDARYAEIDRRMAPVVVGSKMIDTAGNGFDMFPVTVTKIVDREHGRVEVYEASINKHREMSILVLEFVE